MSAIYTEAFRRMGCGFKLISQPGERVMIDANQGIVGGEAGRINSLDQKKYANLIMVPYPITTMQDGAYATDPSIKINGWTINLTGDIGGVAFGSDFAWNALGLMGYRFGLFGEDNAQAFAGYRALSQDYTDGSGDDKFEWDATLYGPVLGLAITF